MSQSQDAELFHMLQTIAIRFESDLQKMLPADGSLNDDFEMWQWCFWKFIDLPAGHPEASKMEATLREALQVVMDGIQKWRSDQ